MQDAPGASINLCDRGWLILVTVDVTLTHLCSHARSDVLFSTLTALSTFRLTSSGKRLSFHGVRHNWIHDFGFFRNRSEWTSHHRYSNTQNLLNVWSHVNRALLGWLSLGFHIDISTLSRSLRRLWISSVAGVRLNSASSHSASVASRTCSLGHFSKQERIEIQNDVFVGDTATTTPGPTSRTCQLVVSPNHGRVTSIDIVSRLRPVTC